MIKTCPNCNTKPDVNKGYINCVNTECNDSGLVYLTGEWNSLDRSKESEARIADMLFQDPV